MHNRTTKFKTYLKRHKKGLSFLSSIIVLVSFTLKEELAEHFKDERAKVNETIARAEKRRDHYAADEIVNSIDERVDVDLLPEI